MPIYVDKQPENTGDLKRLNREILNLLDQKICLVGYDNPNTLCFTISIESVSPEGVTDSTIIRYDNPIHLQLNGE
jgi:hypothetical protein